MILPCYLAMTSAEFDTAPLLPERPAWMACHFSCYNTGLSNLPQNLPEKSMLIVNDRTPVSGHDPNRIVQQLQQLVEKLHVERVLLDLQRQDNEETAKIADAITSALPCPTGVTVPYAMDLDCPVFLPPPPLHIPLAEHLALWKGREIWLELMPDKEELIITQDGCDIRKSNCIEAENPVHWHDELCCSYHIQVSDDAAVFTLERTTSHLDTFLEQAKTLGIVCAVGLYQELKLPE